MAFFKRISDGAKAVGGKVISLLRPGGGGTAGKAVRILLGLVGLAVILVGLWWVNDRLGLERYLEPPLPILGRVWLPFLFLLTLGAGWSAWRLWSTLAAEPTAPPFPDIERAWERAILELGQVGIHIREKPLFLILGRPAATLDGLMEGSGLAMRLRGAPHEPNAPIQLYAGDSGIFVACPTLSVVGTTVDAWLAGAGSVVSEAGATDAASTGTIGPAAGEGTNGATPTTAPQTRRQADRRSLLERARELERTAAGLRLLCRLVVRDRRPYCPINGIIVALPFDLARSDAKSDSIGEACQQDLDTVEAVVQVQCPVFAIFTDLDRQQGFHELASSLAREEPVDSLGIDLPAIPDVRDEAMAGTIDAAVRWLAYRRLPSLIHPLWKFQPDAGLDPVNVRLYELLRAVQEGRRGLSRVLVRGFYRGPRRQAKLAGAYLVATGGTEVARAFGSAVFRRAIDLQNDVSWTPAMIARDRILRWRSGWGYAAIVVWLCGVIAGLLWLVEQFRIKSS
jgi:IcmF-related N-terminal domain